MDPVAFEKLISGRRRGARAALSRLGLRTLSIAYGAAVRGRNRAFDIGLKRLHRAAVPVVSVGNVTTGGTGKTPMVAWLADWFRDRGLRAALLSRGYRALPGGGNDEKLLLDRLCPDVPHVQNPDRVAAAEQACREHGTQVLILDDGFQHRRLGRDLDIVLVDALNPWGYGRLLPRGLLREPVSGLRRANVVVITRADQCTSERREEIRSEIRQSGAVADIAEAAFPSQSLVDAAGTTTPLASLSGRNVTAFCGIGNPSAFRQTLTDQGIRLVQFTPFPDHHHYSDRDLNRVAEEARHADAEALVTTEKDLVKIARAELGGCPLWAVRIGAVFLSGQEALERRLNEVATLSPR